MAPVKGYDIILTIFIKNPTNYLCIEVGFGNTHYVVLPNILAVHVLQPRVLADGVRIYLYRSDDDTAVIVIFNRGLTRCVVNEEPTLIFNQISILPLPIVEALASEFTISHNYSCLRLLILSISAAIMAPDSAKHRMA